MKTRHLFATTSILLCSLLLMTTCYGQPQANKAPDGTDKATKIDELVSTYADYGNFNGAILATDEGS